MAPARLKKGTAQWFRLANLARNFINMSWYDSIVYFVGTIYILLESIWAQAIVSVVWWVKHSFGSVMVGNKVKEGRNIIITVVHTFRLAAFTTFSTTHVANNKRNLKWGVLEVVTPIYWKAEKHKKISPKLCYRTVDKRCYLLLRFPKHMLCAWARTNVIPSFG